MIAALLLLSLAQNPNLQKVVPVWTGQNGYEEYVKAAIILDRPENREFDEYVRFRENPASWQPNSTHPSKEPQRPQDVPEQADLLGVYAAESKHFAPVLELIRQGTAKGVRYPLAQITPATLFPELSLLKRAGLLFEHLACLDFAEGQNTQGTQAILDGLEFSKRVRVAGLIHLLVGMRIEGFMFDAVQRHLGQLSLDGVKKIRAWVDAQSGNGTQVVNAAETERKSYRAAFDEYFTDPKPYLADDIPPASLAKIQSFVKSATPQQKEEVYAYTLKRYEPYYASIAERAKRPEAEWLTPLDVKDPSEWSVPVPHLDVDGSLATLALLQVVQNLSGGVNDALPATLERSFMKERLLGVTCDVVRYRWNNNKLPQSLADVYGKEPLDPATGEKYVYQTLAEGSFKIICHTAALGDVTLTSTNSTASAEPPPPNSARL